MTDTDAAEDNNCIYTQLTQISIYMKTNDLYGVTSSSTVNISPMTTGR